MLGPRQHLPSRGRKLGCLALTLSTKNFIGFSAFRISTGTGPDNNGTMKVPGCIPRGEYSQVVVDMAADAWLKMETGVVGVCLRATGDAATRKRWEMSR